MESDGRMKAYKFVAYSAVTFSVVAVLSVVVTLPMVYNYVNHVRRQMHHELSFCKVSTCLTPLYLTKRLLVGLSQRYQRGSVPHEIDRRHARQPYRPSIGLRCRSKPCAQL